MMSYRLFIGIVEERLKEFLPGWLQDYDIKIDRHHKINSETEFLTMIPPKGMAGTFTCPLIPLSEVYGLFGEDENVNHILHFIANIITENAAGFNDKSFDLNLEDHKDKIVMNILNRQKNPELLQNVPHRNILDFSIIYRFVLQREGDGYGTVIMTNDIMKNLGMNENEVYAIALDNSRRLFPISIRAMGEVFFIITNKENLHGASYMAHDNVLKEIYTMTRGDYYIIPTSMHEFMAVSTKYISLPDAKDMLHRGNREICDEREFLSDNVYFYDGRMDSLRIASPTGDAHEQC